MLTRINRHTTSELRSNTDVKTDSRWEDLPELNVYQWTYRLRGLDQILLVNVSFSTFLVYSFIYILIAQIGWYTINKKKKNNLYRLFASREVFFPIVFFGILFSMPGKECVVLNWIFYCTHFFHYLDIYPGN